MDPFLKDYLIERPDITTFYIDLFVLRDFGLGGKYYFEEPRLTIFLPRDKLILFKHFCIVGIYTLSEPGEPDECCIQVINTSSIVKIQRAWKSYKKYLREKRMDTIKQELMETAWNPKRLVWCLEYNDEYFSLN